MHQDVGMIKKTDNHKNLCDLGIAIPQLLHGSGVEFQSGFAVVQSRNDHGNDFLDAGLHTPRSHNGLILAPVGF